MLEGQALNQFVFVVLVDPDVPKCDAYVCMIEDLFQCHGVVCLLVHMIAERLPWRPVDFEADPRYYPKPVLYRDVSV